MQVFLWNLVAQSVCARFCGRDHLRCPGRALTGVLWESYPWYWRPRSILCGPYCLGESYPYIPGASAMGGVISWRNASQDIMPLICVCRNLSLDQRNDVALWNVILIPIWTYVILSPNMNRRVWDYATKATYFCILSKEYVQGGSNFVLDHFPQNLSMDLILRNAICTPFLCVLPRNWTAQA